MGSKTRLGSYCTKRANNGVNLVTSRKINTRLAHPIVQNLNAPSKRWKEDSRLVITQLYSMLLLARSHNMINHGLCASVVGYDNGVWENREKVKAHPRISAHRYSLKVFSQFSLFTELVDA